MAVDDATVVQRQPDGSITATSCASTGGAAVTNIDTIDIHNESGGRVFPRIDLSNGGFAPGATPEASGLSEIEFNIDSIGEGVLNISGTSTRDVISVGARGVALNTDADADVTLIGAPFVVVDTQAGNDAITAQGGHGAGVDYSGHVQAEGGLGADVLTGSDLGSAFLEGGPGADHVNGTARSTAGYLSSAAGVTVNLAADTASGGDASGDILSGAFGGVLGSDSADHLTADADGAVSRQRGATTRSLEGTDPIRSRAALGQTR
ncbi:MAG: hypothetical protein M3290_07710 [Actinomycetota bacterium]|nr:hypothetical protein [Actinomycetota bacterium]